MGVIEEGTVENHGLSRNPCWQFNNQALWIAGTVWDGQSNRKPKMLVYTGKNVSVFKVSHTLSSCNVVTDPSIGSAFYCVQPAGRTIVDRGADSKRRPAAFFHA